MSRELLKELWQHHRGKMMGALGGLLFAILVMSVGLLWTLFIAFCVFIGYQVGKKMDDEKANLLDILERYLPHGGE